MTSWGREITPNEPEWVGKLIDAEIAKRDAEIARLKEEGTPGVLHAVDDAFLKLAISERNAALGEVDRLHAELAKAQHTTSGCCPQSEELAREVGRLRDTLREVACSGVELDDKRMRYVVIQICRDTWDAIRKEEGDGS